MKALWTRWATKLDALSLRERALVLAVAASLVVILVYAAAIQPLLREQRRHLDRITLDQGQLKAISDELGRSAQAAAQDPRVAKTERMRSLETQLASAEKRLAQRRDTEQLTAAQLTRMLRDMLGGNPNLRLLALRVLPATAIATPAPAAPASQSGAPRPPTVPLYRHGVEIEMTGTYVELLRYLENVEALPWRLAWTNLDLKTTKYPQVQLRATLETISSSPTLIAF